MHLNVLYVLCSYWCFFGELCRAVFYEEELCHLIYEQCKKMGWQGKGSLIVFLVYYTSFVCFFILKKTVFSYFKDVQLCDRGITRKHVLFIIIILVASIKLNNFSLFKFTKGVLSLLSGFSFLVYFDLDFS